MTTKELNNRISQMYEKQNKEIDFCYSTDFEKEFLSLYNSDAKFEQMSKRSILIMLRLNIRYRFVALHNFGIFINIENM